MDLKSLLTLLVYLACYIPPAYFLLRKIGVSSKIISRASMFGPTLGLLQFIVPIGFVFINFEYGYVVGALAGLTMSYFYVRHVVKLEWYKNVGLVIFLPIAAGICATPLMYLLYLANA
jgi:hypothetical protein